MELVPLNENWTGAETKLDLKAIYRRPDPNGVTLTGPLPLRRHRDWRGRGFQYVSLATMDDLGQVASDLRQRLLDPLAMRSSYDPATGRFNVAAYLKEQQQTTDEYVTRLQEKVNRLGYDEVAEVMRDADPSFVMPAAIVKPEPKGKAAKA